MMEREMGQFGTERQSSLRTAWRIAVTLAAIVVPVAGSSDPTALDTDDLPDALFGSWSWTGASGGIAGVTITPESEGYTLTLVFTSPNLVTLSRDGVVQASTTFEFVPGIDDTSVSRSAQLRYAESIPGFFDEQWVEIDKEGDLVLSDPCCDGFTNGWTRN